jgi:hypothetical protein
MDAHMDLRRGPVVVPRTIESSTTTTRLPERSSGSGLNFMRTASSRLRWAG